MSFADLIADFTAGWLGGGAGLLVGHPLDTVKVRLQALKFDGAGTCIASTLKHESIGGFYKGMAFPFLSVGFIHSVYFGGYGLSLKLLNPGLSTKATSFEPTIAQVCLASVIGGVLQWVPACPVDVVKVKLQVQRENVGHFWQHVETNEQRLYRGPYDCARRVLAQHGVRRGLFRGGTVMLIRDLIASLTYLPVFELLYRNLRGAHSENRLSATMIAGGMAGVASWVLIIPFDVVKSRVQADDWSQPRYHGALNCAIRSYREEGVRVFFRGCTVMAVRAFPVNAVIFLVYAYTLEHIHAAFWLP